MGDIRATRRRRKAQFVVVAIAVVAAGCGGGGGPSVVPTAAVPTSTTLPTSAGVTQVLTFQVFDDKGLLPGFVPAATVSGTCTGGSLAASGRADAWRCTAEGKSLDPCFSTEAGGALACAADPFTHDLTMLTVPGALPRGNRTDAGQPPWFLELVDGSRCGPAGPDAVARDSGARYACPNGATVDADPDRSHPTWVAPVRPPTGGAPVGVAVTTAWY